MKCRILHKEELQTELQYHNVLLLDCSNLSKVADSSSLQPQDIHYIIFLNVLDIKHDILVKSFVGHMINDFSSV